MINFLANKIFKIIIDKMSHLHMFSWFFFFFFSQLAAQFAMCKFEIYKFFEWSKQKINDEKEFSTE